MTLSVSCPYLKEIVRGYTCISICGFIDTLNFIQMLAKVLIYRYLKYVRAKVVVSPMK